MFHYAANRGSRNQNEYVRFAAHSIPGSSSDYAVPLHTIEENIKALDVNYPNDLKPLVPILKISPDSQGTMEFMQFYSDLETVFDQYGLLKIIFNSDRFRPMVPQLVSQDMLFMLKEPQAYKSQMLDLPLPQTPISKIKEPQPLLSKPTGYVELTRVLGGENLADRLQAAMSPTGVRIPDRSNITSPGTRLNLDDEEVSVGAGANETATNVKITEWTVDISSELFHHTTISRDEALFTKITRLHEKAIKFIWRVIMFGIQGCPKA
jgi:hypothetical protein